MEDEISTLPRHLDAGGRPLCGRDPEGELFVEQPVDVTCTVCLVEYGKLLAKHEPASA